MRRTFLAAAAMAASVGLAASSHDPIRADLPDDYRPRRSKRPGNKPKRRPNRLHVSKRVRRAHRRAAK